MRRYIIAAGNKSLIIISETGKPVRTIRINFFTVFFFILFVTAGGAAYFIPSGFFTLKSEDLSRKKEIKQQNLALHGRTDAAMETLKSIREQLSGLEAKKEHVSTLMGGSDTVVATRKVASPASRAAVPFPFDLNRLLDRVTRRHATLVAFAGRPGNPFDSLPVCKPVPAYAAIAVGFGQARDPFTNKYKWHNGVDFAAPEKTPVFAAASGKVVKSENDPVWGKRIVIDHKNGYTTVYAHLGKALAAKGRKVKRGEVIGEIGYSGITTGPHLHYEIRRDSAAVDPEAYFFPMKLAVR